MPIISAGTAGYNDSQAALAVRAALAGNVTAIHTAFDYFNLAGVAKGLEARPRREIFLASMTSPCVHDSPPARNVTDAGACEALTTRELESVLTSLNTTYLDLVMLHGPSEPFGYEGACSEAVCKLNSAQWAAYEKFMRAGKARAVGAYSPLASGAVVRDADVAKIAAKVGKSAAQVALRYVLQNGAKPSVVVKASKPAYLAEDLDVFDFELSAADVATLDAKTTPAGQQDGRPSWGCAAYVRRRRLGRRRRSPTQC
ncbi:oxidoreductase [Aureococcus anophagefferens]|nr:oxidoreductase [Aureococcus anophagefferens]